MKFFDRVLRLLGWNRERTYPTQFVDEAGAPLGPVQPMTMTNIDKAAQRYTKSGVPGDPDVMRKFFDRFPDAVCQVTVADPSPPRRDFN